VLLSIFGTEECIREGGGSSEEDFVEGEEADESAYAHDKKEQARAAVGEEEN
jgi:hypothetical protein